MASWEFRESWPLYALCLTVSMRAIGIKTIVSDSIINFSFLLSYLDPAHQIA